MIAERPLCHGEFNRSTQHPSLERTDCWCRSNFSIKSQDIRHRSRSFERLWRYPPILAALPALSALCLQLRREPCPYMSLHMHAIPTWQIRVKGCCVDRLSPPGQSGRSAIIAHRPRFMRTRPSARCRDRSRTAECRASGSAARARCPDGRAARVWRCRQAPARSDDGAAREPGR
jgi:hypothetical protein